MIREGTAWVVLRVRGGVLAVMAGCDWAQVRLLRLAQWVRGDRGAGR